MKKQNHFPNIIFDNKKKLVEIGTIECSGIKNTQLKLKKIGTVSSKLLRKYKPNKIIVESGFSRFNTVTQQLFRVHGLINYIFYKQEQIYISSKKVRVLICGNGNIKKDDFFNFVENKYKKIKFKNNDEADSYALGLAYFNMQGYK